MPVSNSDFTNKLASFAAPKVELPHVVLAASDNEVLDQACQSAEAYWMSGWHENEISAVLEDEGFPDDIVKKALEVLTEHAEDLLNKGPFSLLEAGQLVKLANGGSGVLKEKRAKIVVLQVGEDLVQVVAEQIDVPATASLTRAFQLRKEAVKHVASIGIVGADDPTSREVNLPEETTETYLTTREGNPLQRAPSGGYAEAVPENIGDVQQAVDVLDKKNLANLAQIKELVKRSGSRAEKRKQLQKKLQDAMSKTGIPQELGKLQKEELGDKEQTVEYVSEINSYVASLEGIDQDQYLVLIKSEDSFLAIDRYLKDVPNKKFSAEKLALIDSLISKNPEKYAAMKKQLDAFDAKFTAVEQIVNVFAMWPIPETLIKQSQSWSDKLGDWWKKLKQATVSLWQGIQEYASSWYNDLGPQFESQSQELDAFLASEQQDIEGQEALEATASILNYAQKRR
jgi:hypothetical protein